MVSGKGLSASLKDQVNEKPLGSAFPLQIIVVIFKNWSLLLVSIF